MVFQCRDFPQSYVAMLLAIGTNNLLHNIYIARIPTPFWNWWVFNTLVKLYLVRTFQIKMNVKTTMEGVITIVVTQLVATTAHVLKDTLLIKKTDTDVTKSVSPSSRYCIMHTWILFYKIFNELLIILCNTYQILQQRWSLNNYYFDGTFWHNFRMGRALTHLLVLWVSKQ